MITPAKDENIPRVYIIEGIIPYKTKWKSPTKIPLDDTIDTTGPATPQDIAIKRKISARHKKKATMKYTPSLS